MLKPKQYEVHPAASIFPMMSLAEFNLLKKSIEDNGQCEPVVMFQGMILDGRNRVAACEDLGIEPHMCDLDDDDPEFDPVQFVLDHNLRRRQLKVSQRSMIAAKMATLKDGHRPSQNCEAKREAAAAALSVSPRSLDSAKQVLEHGSKEIIEAVELGDLSVGFASKFVIEEPDKKTQTELWKEGGKKALKEHITEPSPYVDSDDEQKQTAVKSFKSMWKKWDDVQRAAVRVWLDEHYLDSK